VYDNHETVACN